MLLVTLYMSDVNIYFVVFGFFFIFLSVNIEQNWNGQTDSEALLLLYHFYVMNLRNHTTNREEFFFVM